MLRYRNSSLLIASLFQYLNTTHGSIVKLLLHALLIASKYYFYPNALEIRVRLLEVELRNPFTWKQK